MRVRGSGCRIAIFLPDLRGGGAERVNLHLAREEHMVRGYEVDFVLMSARGNFLARCRWIDFS